MSTVAIASRADIAEAIEAMDAAIADLNEARMRANVNAVARAWRELTENITHYEKAKRAAALLSGYD